MSSQAQDSVTRWLQAAGRQPLLTPAEELHLGTLIRAWQDHPDGPANAPAAVLRRGKRARDRMVAGNLRLVAKVASRGHRGISREDALQAGAIGLQRGAERFDPERGYKFSTFAYWWIRQAIAREVAASASIIKVPSSYGQLAGRIHRTHAELLQLLQRAPTLSEVAVHVGIPEQEVRLFLERSGAGVSLDAKAGGVEDRSSILDMLAAPSADADLIADMASAIELLTARQRLIVTRHCLHGERLIAVAQSLGISRDAAGQELKRGLARLRRLLHNYQASPPPAADKANQDQPERPGFRQSQAGSRELGPRSGGDPYSSVDIEPNQAGPPGRAGQAGESLAVPVQGLVERSD